MSRLWTKGESSYNKGQRLTTHGLFPAHMKNKYSTHQEDMPPAFRHTVQWDDTRIRNWAVSIGPNTSEVIERIFRSKSRATILA